MDIRVFRVGDHVRLKACVLEEGIILAPAEEHRKENFYFVIFCMGTTYEAKPWIQCLHADKLSLIEPEIHKQKEPSRFIKK
jgi:hypothetical protein